MCDDTKTTHTDSDTIVADSRRPFTGECRGVLGPIRVVLPGDEPGTYRAIVCEDLDEAAFRLVRHRQQSRKEAVTSQRPEFNYQHPVYLRARDKAFARSDDDCQLCGQQPAAEAHHWAVDYPPAHKTAAGDLTALCADCHFIATTLRRFTRAGGARHQFCALLSEAITQCDLNSPLPASPQSSCTMERPDSTREALSAARSQRSITAKRGGNRTPVDDERLRRLECQRSLYLDAGGRPTLPLIIAYDHQEKGSSRRYCFADDTRTAAIRFRKSMLPSGAPEKGSKVSVSVAK